MTKATVFTKGGNSGNIDCTLPESISFAQRARLFPDEDGSSLK
jgi:hypothetical protein